MTVLFFSKVLDVGLMKCGQYSLVVWIFIRVVVFRMVLNNCLLDITLKYVEGSLRLSL